MAVRSQLPPAPQRKRARPIPKAAARAAAASRAGRTVTAEGRADESKSIDQRLQGVHGLVDAVGVLRAQLAAADEGQVDP
jgi:hypothetical protein